MVDVMANIDVVIDGELYTPVRFLCGDSRR